MIYTEVVIFAATVSVLLLLTCFAITYNTIGMSKFEDFNILVCANFPL